MPNRDIDLSVYTLLDERSTRVFNSIHSSQNIEKNQVSLIEFLTPFEILNFDDNDADQFGRIGSELKKASQLIGPYNLLIAAQALAKDLILVTNNTDEFKRVDGLKFENWK